MCKYLPLESAATKFFQCAQLCKYLLDRESWFNNNEKWIELFELCPSQIWIIQIKTRKQAFNREESYRTLIEVRKILRELKRTGLESLEYTEEYSQFCKEIDNQTVCIKNILKSLYDKWE